MVPSETVPDPRGNHQAGVPAMLGVLGSRCLTSGGRTVPVPGGVGRIVSIYLTMKDLLLLNLLIIHVYPGALGPCLLSEVDPDHRLQGLLPVEVMVLAEGPLIDTGFREGFHQPGGLHFIEILPGRTAGTMVFGLPIPDEYDEASTLSPLFGTQPYSHVTE